MITDLLSNLESIHTEVMTKLIPENIKKNVTVLNVTGTYEGSGQQINNQDKNITQNGIYTADSGYTGLGEVDVHIPIYKVPVYEDLVNISDAQINDYAVIDNSWYDATIISNIRTLLNAQYAADYGENIRQNNNIILYDVNTHSYCAPYVYMTGSPQQDWDTNGWTCRRSLTDSYDTCRLIDPRSNL